MSDIPEMYLHRFPDVNLPQRTAKLLHHPYRIVMRAAGGSESRHGNGYDPFPVQSHEVVGTHHDQERKGGVQSA